MTRAVHPVCSERAILMILTYWIFTILSEAFGSAATITGVKTWILWGFLVLVPALMAPCGIGFALFKDRRSGLVAAKLKRMPLFAVNGVVVLIPSALFLASKASKCEFDIMFYSVQIIELIAGIVNITLLSLNLRDGLRMTS